MLHLRNTSKGVFLFTVLIFINIKLNLLSAL